MACYRPLRAYKLTTGGVSFRKLDDNYGAIELPCGQCIGCRMQRAQDWTIRCMHEASLHQENCFITLTYERDKLPLS